MCFLDLLETKNTFGTTMVKIVFGKLALFTDEWEFYKIEYGKSG